MENTHLLFAKTKTNIGVNKLKGEFTAPFFLKF